MRDFKIYFCKVGNGHCSYIEFPNGKNGLIDVKVNKENGYDNIVALLKKASISKIDYLFITHPHQDHIGGLSELVSNFIIGKFIYSPVYFKPDPIYDDWKIYEKMKQGYHCEVKNEVKNGLYTIIGECIVEYLAPFDSLLKTRPDDVNNSGLLIKINYMGHTIIIPGDIERDGWDYVDDNDIRNSTLLLASHHGNDSGYNIQKLKIMNPDFVVISTGAKTEYDADKKYRNQVQKVFTTRKERIVAKIDGQKTLHIE